MSPAQASRGVPKKIDKNALLVAQEITFAKILSGNDEKSRERAIKRLRKWLTLRSSSVCPFKETDLKRIWKGLFYCMWMSDTPLVQEEVADNISKLVHCFKNTEACMYFTKCFFLTMGVEWRGLDNWRMNKFLMFIRRFVRQVLTYLEQLSWPLELVNKFGEVINSTVLPDHATLSSVGHPPTGFSMHFIDVYVDELTKVSKGNLQNDDILAALLRPFAVYLSDTTERTVGLQIVSQVFDRLIEQSKEGHKFREKFEAWKQLGFPGGNINTIMKVSEDDSDEEMDSDSGDDEEKPLDPRAGGVNVELPVARFNPEAVANLLREFRHSKTSSSWSRRMIARVISRFCAMKKGKYPLGVTKVEQVPKINFKTLAKQSAKELFDFRESLMQEDEDEWLENIKRRKGKGNQAVQQEKAEEEDEDDSDDDDDVEEDVADDDDVDDDVDDDDDVNDDVSVDESEDESEGSDVGEQESDEDINGVSDDEEEEESEGAIDDEDDDNEAEEDEEEEDDVEADCSEEEPVPSKKKKECAVSAQNSPATPAASPAGSNGVSPRSRKMLKNRGNSKEEVVIVYGRKRKLSDALSTPVIQRSKHLKSPQKSPRTPMTPGSAKKLQFILQRNTVQTTSEYDKLLKEKPGNPYDSSKKPRYSVLKSTPVASPVNPFYTPQ